jgi:ubiquinone biosynthesis protein COQ4
MYTIKRVKSVKSAKKLCTYFREKSFVAFNNNDNLQWKSYVTSTKPVCYRRRVQTTGLQRLLLAANSAFGAIRDPTRADLIATLGETTGKLQLQNMHQQMLNNPDGMNILKSKPRVNQENVDVKKLLGMNVSTFGYQYGTFLETHGFDPDDRPPVKYITDENLAYVITRYREIHDFAHVILELPPNVCGEIALKWFEMGQTNLPMTTLSALVGPLRVTDHNEKQFIRKYISWSSKYAKHSKLLINIYFEELFERDLKELQLDILGENAFNNMPKYDLPY